MILRYESKAVIIVNVLTSPSAVLERNNLKTADVFEISVA